MSHNPMEVVEIEHLIEVTLGSIGLRREIWDGLLENPVNAEPLWPGFQATLKSGAGFAPFIDHTLLKADATDSTVEKLCSEAKQWGFASVCVNSCHIASCTTLTQGSSVKVCGVVGFPLGAMSTVAKAEETWSIVRDGGVEIDMVMNIGKLKSADPAYVRDDIGAVVEAAEGRPVKVILETGLLSDPEIVASCVIAVVAGASFVKTSTGFGSGGATEAHVSLMRRVVGQHHGVKASGGIRDSDAAKRMIRAGANRIGTSNGVAIVSGSSARSSY